jgi:integrase
LRTKNGSRVPYKTLLNQFDKLLNELGIIKGDRTLHSLRHTFATKAVERGANITNLSRYLGHASTSITYNVYVHGTSEGFREFVEDNMQ